MRRLEHPGIIRLKDVFVKPAATGTTKGGARARGAIGGEGARGLHVGRMAGRLALV